MNRMKRTIVAGTLAALALAGGLATSSAAATPSANASVAPASASASPPAGSKQFGRTYCLAGHLCLFYLNSAHDGLYASYYYCERVYLSGWFGSGELMNNQTSGTVSTFYGESGNVITTSKAYQEKGIDWDDVWSIKVC
jgi:hypothetical protein